MRVKFNFAESFCRLRITQFFILIFKQGKKIMQNGEVKNEQIFSFFTQQNKSAYKILSFCCHEVIIAKTMFRGF